MTTPLGKIQTDAAKAAKTAAYETKMSKLANGRRGETLEVPGLGLVRLELPSSVAIDEIEFALLDAMKARNVAFNTLTLDRFETARARATLAIAARDPDDPTKPFGTHEQWAELDAMALGAAWASYLDVQERLNPLATPLSDDERAQIEIAVKKKDGTLLRSFALAKLCEWLCTSDVLPSTSASPTSSDSESSSNS